MPANVRHGLFDKVGNLEPTLEDIFGNAYTIIRKIFLENSYICPYPKSTSDWSSNKGNNKLVSVVQNNKKAKGKLSNTLQPQGSIPKQKSGTTATNKKNSRCIFCESNQHSSSRCPNLATLEERGKRLRKVYSSPCIKCQAPKKWSRNCTVVCKPCDANGHHSTLFPDLIVELNKINTVGAVGTKYTKADKSIALPTIS